MLPFRKPTKKIYNSILFPKYRNDFNGHFPSLSVHLIREISHSYPIEPLKIPFSNGCSMIAFLTLPCGRGSKPRIFNSNQMNLYVPASFKRSLGTRLLTHPRLNFPTAVSAAPPSHWLARPQHDAVSRAKKYPEMQCWKKPTGPGP